MLDKPVKGLNGEFLLLYFVASEYKFAAENTRFQNANIQFSRSTLLYQRQIRGAGLQR